MLHKHPLHPILSLFIALLIGSSTMWACNSFSHQWSLTGLEEETDRLPRLAMGELFRRLPQHLASASVTIPWLQTASSVLLLEVDAATYSWVFQNAPQQGASKSCGILAQTSEMPRETIIFDIYNSGHNGIPVVPRLEPAGPASDAYALLQKRASETGSCVAAIEVISGYQSLSHFVDLLPIRVGTIRAQNFERVEVLVRIAGPNGEIGLVGPLKAEVTLSTDSRLHLATAYIGRLEWRADQEPVRLMDLTTLLPAALPTASPTSR